jgi:hypothetical protein
LEQKKNNKELAKVEHVAVEEIEGDCGEKLYEEWLKINNENPFYKDKPKEAKANAAEETITSELLENMAKSIEQAEKSENQ